MEHHENPQDAMAGVNPEYSVIPISELLSEAEQAKHAGNPRRVRRSHKYIILLRDLTTGTTKRRGPIRAKDQNAALLKAFGLKTSRWDGRGPSADLQRLLFALGALAQKPLPQTLQLVEIEPFDYTASTRLIQESIVEVAL
jgi:hypothetical protein